MSKSKWFLKFAGNRRDCVTMCVVEELQVTMWNYIGL